MPDKDKKPTDDAIDSTKPQVNSDTYSQVDDADASNVKGGMPRRGGSNFVTGNPTGSDGCCGQ